MDTSFQLYECTNICMDTSLCWRQQQKKIRRLEVHSVAPACAWEKWRHAEKKEQGHAEKEQGQRERASWSFCQSIYCL